MREIVLNGLEKDFFEVMKRIEISDSQTLNFQARRTRY